MTTFFEKPFPANVQLLVAERGGFKTSHLAALRRQGPVIAIDGTNTTPAYLYRWLTTHSYVYGDSRSSLITFDEICIGEQRTLWSFDKICEFARNFPHVRFIVAIGAEEFRK